MLALAPCLTYAQKTGRSLVDSLYNELDLSEDDTNKVKILDRLSYLYANINPDSGIALAEEAMSLAKQLKWERGIAVANSDMATNFQAKSDYGKALEYNAQALALYKKSGNKRSIAAVLSNIAIIHQSLGNYSGALDNYLKALAVMEELDDKRSMAIILENTGTLYKEQGDLQRALEHYISALEINKKLGDRSGLARNYGNIGTIHDAEGQYARALENHLAALKENREAENRFGMQVNLANIGIVYLHLGEMKKALGYQEQALAISKELGNKGSIAVNTGNIGVTYFSLATGSTNAGVTPQEIDRFYMQKAINYLEESVTLCREINYLAPTTEFIPHLTEAYSLSGNYSKAFEYQKLYSEIKDSIFSVQSKLEIANLESKREAELKKKDLELKDKQIKITQLQLERKRNAQVLYIMGIALLLLVLGIAIRSILAYRRSNKLLTKAQSLHKDIILKQNQDISERNKILEEIAYKHSHDIRGHIATILGLSQMFNKEDYADPTNKTLVDGIETSAEQLDNVIKEIVKKENELKRPH